MNSIQEYIIVAMEVDLNFKIDGIQQMYPKN